MNSGNIIDELPDIENQKNKTEVIEIKDDNFKNEIKNKSSNIKDLKEVVIGDVENILEVGGEKKKENHESPWDKVASTFKILVNTIAEEEFVDEKNEKKSNNLSENENLTTEIINIVDEKKENIKPVVKEDREKATKQFIDNLVNLRKSSLEGLEKNKKPKDNKKLELDLDQEVIKKFSELINNAGFELKRRESIISSDKDLKKNYKEREKEVLDIISEKIESEMKALEKTKENDCGKELEENKKLKEEYKELLHFTLQLAEQTTSNKRRKSFNLKDVFKRVSDNLTLLPGSDKDGIDELKEVFTGKKGKTNSGSEDEKKTENEVGKEEIVVSNLNSVENLNPVASAGIFKRGITWLKNHGYKTTVLFGVGGFLVGSYILKSAIETWFKWAESVTDPTAKVFINIGQSLGSGVLLGLVGAAIGFPIDVLFFWCCGRRSKLKKDKEEEKLKDVANNFSQLKEILEHKGGLEELKKIAQEGGGSLEQYIGRLIDERTEGSSDEKKSPIQEEDITKLIEEKLSQRMNEKLDELKNKKGIENLENIIEELVSKKLEESSKKNSEKTIEVNEIIRRSIEKNKEKQEARKRRSLSTSDTEGIKRNSDIKKDEKTLNEMLQKIKDKQTEENLLKV